MNRLPPFPTQRVDRSRRVRFSWCGREMEGLAGDTVASALWASGVRTLSRSFEYHRPRGLYDFDGEGSGQLVSVDGVANQSAGTTPVREGMAVAAQNVRGDPRRDALGFLDWLDPLMPAGFYYRIFHRPAWAALFFQERMRRLAGLGVLRRDAAPRGKRSERYLNADVAVVGGGPAGLSAALAAARLGLRVCLFERRPWLGGHLDWRVRDGRPLGTVAAQLVGELEREPSARVFLDAPATGIWGENLVTGFQRLVGGDNAAPGAPPGECHWECRARAVVVATGAIERPLVFEHNDRPGAMHADAALRLARTYAVRPGAATAFSVGDDLGLEAALDLSSLGVRVQVVADARSEGHDSALVDALAAAGIAFRPGWAARRARGRGRVRGAELAPLHGGGAARDALRVSCDLLVASAGRQPDIGILSTAGARFGHGERTGTFELRHLPPRVYAAGGALRLEDVDAIRCSGRLAGLEAAAACGTDVGDQLAEARAELADLPGSAAGEGIVRGPGIGKGRKAFIDFDEDGTWKKAVQCAKYGFDRPELAKRFGNFGLGSGQYRAPGQNLAMATAEILGRPAGEFAATTVRPPVIAPSVATLAGPNPHLHKRSPLHEALREQGAVFRRAGPWLRPRYFGSDPEARAEIRKVRRNVGLLDSSPLGKFKLWGPDALRALQRVYVSDMRRVERGRCTYSAMCNDMGHLVDDGVVIRIGENEYYLTTSTGRAGATVEWFRFHTRCEGWDYSLVNLTDALASINVAGPNARRVLEKITDADLSDEAFPYLGYREIKLAGAREDGATSHEDGVSARCLRLGFVGEASWELHVDASRARWVWDRLLAAGAEFGIRPFGLEAQSCLRAEKGHVIINTESESRVTLLDLGMGWLWDRADTASRKVGAPALRASAEQEGRLKLTGLRIDAGPEDGPGDGAVVVEGGRVAGYACTTRFSETLGWRYALALIEEPLAAPGRALELREARANGTARFKAEVVRPPFYDPSGSRMRGSPGAAGAPSTSSVTPPSSPARSRSPIRFSSRLGSEPGAASLVNLSHRRRWDLQARDPEEVPPWGPHVPRRPGEVAVRDGMLLSRLNATQAALWHVGPDPAPSAPPGPDHTETTDAHCWLAIVGRAAPEVMESVTSLDLFDPARARPFLAQGPVLHVPCQVVTWRDDCMLIACARGYGAKFAQALLAAGGEAGLRPADERLFASWTGAHA